MTVLVSVHAGSNYEEKNVNGISHFLEHLCFKGTKKRPNTLALSAELDSIGAEYNAFTSKEWTGYYVKADAQYAEQIMDILSDMYCNSLFDEQEIEREKGVILEEMNMYYDTPMKYIDDCIEETLYGDQPQGWKVIGSAKTVKSLTRKKIVDYFAKHYSASNTILLISGAVPHNVRRFAQKYFTLPRTVKKHQRTAVYEKQSAPKITIHYKKTDQAHLDIALRAYKAGDGRLPSLHLLNILLGGNMSSRLFINIREREGLCYYINSHIQEYSQSGYMLIKAGVDTTRCRRAVSLIMQELKKIRDEGVTDAELKKAQQYARGKLSLSLETSDEFAFFASEQLITTRRIKTPEEIVSELMAVTQRDITKRAREVIQNNRLNVAVIGPYKDRRIFEKVMFV